MKTKQNDTWKDQRFGKTEIETSVNRRESEAATGGILLKKVSLKIFQNLQENTCARVSLLIKLQTSDLQLC